MSLALQIKMDEVWPTVADSLGMKVGSGKLRNYRYSISTINRTSPLMAAPSESTPPLPFRYYI